LTAKFFPADKTYFHNHPRLHPSVPLIDLVLIGVTSDIPGIELPLLKHGFEVVTDIELLRPDVPRNDCCNDLHTIPIDTVLCLAGEMT